MSKWVDSVGGSEGSARSVDHFVFLYAALAPP